MVITAGAYNERLQVSRSGTPNNYITISAHPNDIGQVIIDGSGIDIGWWGGLIEICDSSYVVVQGLTITNSDFSSIFVQNADNIIISNNHSIHSAASGIYTINATNITIDSNSVRWANESKYQEGISIVDTTHFEVSNNAVYDGVGLEHGGEGICVKTSGESGTTHSGVVHGNYIHDLPGDVGLYIGAYAQGEHLYNIQAYDNIVTTDVGIGISSELGGLTEAVYVYNNIVYNNRSTGIIISNWNGFDVEGPKRDIFIVNNTVYNTGHDDSGTPKGGGILIQSEHSSNENFVVTNNIVSQGSSYQLLINEGAVDITTAAYNLIDGFRGIDTRETRGYYYQEGDPCFSNSGTGDFHITSGSPAIDNGESNQIATVDYDGNSRPNGTHFDIGAFEYSR